MYDAHILLKISCKKELQWLKKFNLLDYNHNLKIY